MGLQRCAQLVKIAPTNAITSFAEFPGRSHLIVAQTGWEEVAEHALLSAQKQVALRTAAPSL